MSLASAETNDDADRLARFAAAVEARFDPDRPQTLWTLEPDLRVLFGEGFAARCLVRLLREVRDEALGAEVVANQWVLHRAPGIGLSLMRAQAAPTLVSASFTALYLPVQAPLRIVRYRLPAAFRSEEFDPAMQLERVGKHWVAVGDALRVDAPERELVDFEPPTPTLVAKLSLASHLGLRWHFDRASLEALRAEIAEPAWSALRLSAELLGEVGGAGSIPVLDRLTRHAHPRVRWSALRSLLRGDPTQARRRLEVALDDPNAQVRDAARRSLEGAAPREGTSP